MKNLSVIQKYLFGMTFWMVLYATALFASILTIKSQQPQGAILYALAVMPALPIGGTLWVVLRYIEKADEYVRAMMSRTFVITTGVLLFLTTVWGFLESNAGIPHFPLMWVFPVFWMIFAAVQLANRIVCGELR